MTLPPRVVTLSVFFLPLKPHCLAKGSRTKLVPLPVSNMVEAMRPLGARTLMMRRTTISSRSSSTDIDSICIWNTIIQTLASKHKSSCILWGLEHPRSVLPPPHTLSFFLQSSGLWSPKQWIQSLFSLIKLIRRAISVIFRSSTHAFEKHFLDLRSLCRAHQNCFTFGG